MARYEILESKMDALRKKITRIENKCAKFGNEFHYAEVGETVKEVVDSFGNCHKLRFVVVEAEGTARVNGWEFVAKVEHTAKGNLLMKAFCDAKIPERYKTSECYCEHCNSRRARKNTFIVRNMATNEFRQVGKSCLNDYTHGMSADMALWYASIVDVFKEAETVDYTAFHRCEELFDTNEVLRYCAETVRHFGYKKAWDEFGDEVPDSSKLRAKLYYKVSEQGYSFDKSTLRKVNEEMDAVGFDADSKTAHESVKNALKWLETVEDNSEYIHNLKVACSLDFVGYKHFGLLVSLFPAYERAMKKDAQREADAVSNWVSEVGQRVTFEAKSCVCVACWENAFGLSYIYKFTDESGNVFIWKTSKCIEEYKVKTVVGTVKEHDDYKGVKQTVLTRCKVA